MGTNDAYDECNRCKKIVEEDFYPIFMDPTCWVVCAECANEVFQFIENKDAFVRKEVIGL